MKKAYIAGPMRGIEDYNFPAFDTAARFVYEMGYHPISPAAMDRLFEGWAKAPPKHLTFGPDDLRRFMRRDLITILDLNPKTDMLYMLKGWRDSKGAVTEKALADALDINVVYEL